MSLTKNTWPDKYTESTVTTLTAVYIGDVDQLREILGAQVFELVSHLVRRTTTRRSDSDAVLVSIADLGGYSAHIEDLLRRELGLAILRDLEAQQ